MADFAREELLSETEEPVWEERHERHGGPQDDDEEEEDGGGGGGGAGDDEERKRQERERKKAEVRKRLEESNRKKAKKGFLTPERKKKLRKLLMIKAAEDLKQQQMKKEQERKAVLEKRITKLPDVDGINDQGKLQQIATELLKKIEEVETIKYDLDFQVRQKDHEINELSIAVNDLRGKFVKPTLKKVSKYDNKFKKMADANKNAEKMDFRANLKKSEDSTKKMLDALTKDKKSDDQPEWAKKPGHDDVPREPRQSEPEAAQEEAEVAEDEE